MAQKKYLTQKVAAPDISSNQLIEYSFSGITLTNNKYRRKNSHNITVRNCCQTHLTLVILDPSFVGQGLLKDEPITFSLTEFHFHRSLYQEKLKIFGEIVG